MKQYFKQIIACVLTLAMLFSVSIVSVNANAAEAKEQHPMILGENIKLDHPGPCKEWSDSGYIAFGLIDKLDGAMIFSRYNTIKAWVPGAKYDYDTNTLTLNNFVSKDTVIEVNAMGDDFKILVLGKNEVGQIVVNGGYNSWGGSVAFIGNGEICINEKKRNKPGILLDAGIVNDKSKARIYVSSTVDMCVHAAENMGAIVVRNGKVDDKSMALPYIADGKGGAKRDYISSIVRTADKYVNAINRKDTAQVFVASHKIAEKNRMKYGFERIGNTYFTYTLATTEEGIKVALEPQIEEHFVDFNYLTCDYKTKEEYAFMGYYRLVKWAEDGKEYLLCYGEKGVSLHPAKQVKLKEFDGTFTELGSPVKVYTSEEVKKMFEDGKFPWEALGQYEVRYETTTPGLTLEFKAMKNKAVIKNMKATKKGFTCTVTSKDVGYGITILYATKSDMSDAKAIDVQKKNVTDRSVKVTVKNLKAGKKYYVMAIPYRLTTNEFKNYGIHSSIKTVTTKK